MLNSQASKQKQNTSDVNKSIILHNIATMKCYVICCKVCKNFKYDSNIFLSQKVYNRGPNRKKIKIIQISMENV